MPPRRAALVVTILLGATGVITYLRPPLQPAAQSTAPTVVERPASEPARGAPDEEQVTLDAANPSEPTVPTATRVVLSVKVPEAGDVEIRDLGLIASAAPNSPAVFDLLLAEPGEHRVLFRPAGGGERPAGSLVAR